MRPRRRIPNADHQRCLELFNEGYGYKRTAALTGISKYTVRDYLRRYRLNDISWAQRGCDGSESKEVYPDVDSFRY